MREKVKLETAAAYALTNGWVQNSGVFFLGSAIALVLAVVMSKEIKLAAYTFASAGTLFLWITAFVIVRHTVAAENPPFATAIETSFIGERRDNTQFFAEYNRQYLSPVPMLLFVRIVNLQDVPAKVSLVKIDVEQTRRKWLGSAWITPTQVPEQMPLVWVNPAPVAPRRLELIGPYLATVLQRPIAPHDTVWGWLLLDVPPEYDSGTRPVFLRVSIRDTAGHEIVVLNPRSDDNIANPPRGWNVLGVVDLTGYSVRHLSEN